MWFYLWEFYFCCYLQSSSVTNLIFFIKLSVATVIHKFIKLQIWQSQLCCFFTYFTVHSNRQQWYKKKWNYVQKVSIKHHTNFSHTSSRSTSVAILLSFLPSTGNLLHVLSTTSHFFYLLHILSTRSQFFTFYFFLAINNNNNNNNPCLLHKLKDLSTNQLTTYWFLFF